MREMISSGNRGGAGAVALLLLFAVPGGGMAGPIPPAPPSGARVRAALVESGAAPKPLRVLLLAGRKDHGVNEHDYPLWQECWARLLGGASACGAGRVNLFGEPVAAGDAPGPGIVAVTLATGWPGEGQLAAADVVVAFCYVAWDEARAGRMARYLERGGGLVLIHSATWTKPGPDAGVAALAGVGGFTRFRHGAVDLEIDAGAHPICAGMPGRVALVDETYWPPTPPVAPGRIAVLASSRERDPASGEAVAQPMFWTCATGRGRVFGCVPGHYVWTFDDPWFRILLLRGVAWAGGVPEHQLDPLVLRGARVAPD